MIALQNIAKEYRLGENRVLALDGVSLSIEDGDFLAIMGPSGSGKSTLMHIIGLLDTPSRGSYKIDGREVSRLSEDDLAVLRRETIGFIFQQFNLLPRLTALENAALPLLYSQRHPEVNRARQLLTRVGLSERLAHRSNELSGGQQQRVAIARALVNGPRLILADEPTGNLDSASEKEILQILKELNSAGITVIIVTHNEEIAAQAHRQVRLRDGQIVSDQRLAPRPTAPPARRQSAPGRDRGFFGLAEFAEHFRQGFKTLGANKVRTGLSMLGILIGVAAVVAMLAIGRGAQKAVEKQLSSLGSNLLVLRPGAMRMGGVAQQAGTTTRLTLEDAAALQEQLPATVEASPAVQGRGQLTFQDKNWNTQLLGAGPSYTRIHAAQPEVGRFFTADENTRRSRVAVVGATVVRELFGDRDPIGELIKINKVNFQIVGILPVKGATGFRDQDDVVVIPLLTAMRRVMGKNYVDYIDLQMAAGTDLEQTQKQVLDLILSRHKVALSQSKDAFNVRNMADIQAAVSQSSRTLSLLLSSIAAISLLVGGIGIMNIMLVSVAERTREVGLRKAVGARRGDILWQFLTEATVVSVVGGSSGIVFGWLITVALSAMAGWTSAISVGSVALAFFFSAAVGVIFGSYPARRASLLPPIEALRYE